jgi:hypothetical protein
MLDHYPQQCSDSIVAQFGSVRKTVNYLVNYLGSYLVRQTELPCFFLADIIENEIEM